MKKLSLLLLTLLVITSCNLFESQEDTNETTFIGTWNAEITYGDYIDTPGIDSEVETIQFVFTENTFTITQTLILTGTQEAIDGINTSQDWQAPLGTTTFIDKIEGLLVKIDDHNFTTTITYMTDYDGVKRTPEEYCVYESENYYVDDYQETYSCAWYEDKLLLVMGSWSGIELTKE